MRRNDKEKDKNIVKYKQILYKIAMSNFVEKEEWTQLNHCTQVHKLEGKMELKCA